MDEPHAVAAQLEAEIERQLAHEVLRALIGVLERPRHGPLTKLAVVFGDVSAPAILELAGDRVVVVAVDRGDPVFGDQLADLVGTRAVPDQVAAAIDRIRVDRLQARLKRGEVAVNVGDDRHPVHAAAQSID